MTRLSFACFALISCVFSGCFKQQDSTAQQTPKQTIADRDRPPLRIGLISQPTGLDELLRMRWASVSEQRLEFVPVNLEEVVSSDKSPKLDLIIAPALHIGSLVEARAVSELASDIVDSALKSSESTAITLFPDHWIKMAQYGKKQYGVPYGSSLILIGSEAQSAAPAEGAAAGAVPTTVVDWAKYRMNKPTEDPSNSLPDIVDHFTTIAASHRPNFYEGSTLFKVVDGSSRLSEAWLVDSAATLRTLYSSSSGNEAKLIELGWETTKSDTKSTWAVPTIEKQIAASSNSGANAPQVAPADAQQWGALVDSARGPVIYLSSNTRQSSQASYFVKWLCEAPQKSAFAKTWPWSFNISEGTEAGRNNTYRAVAFKASQMSGDIATSFQLRNGWQYRQMLKEALQRIVENQQTDIVKEMEACRLQWDSLTESLGKEFQQDSLERTLN